MDGSGDRSAVWDGVVKAIDATASCLSQNRIVILTSDGDDNHSLFEAGKEHEPRVASLVEKAHSAGTKVCTIGIPSDTRRDELLLQLATGTGCAYYQAENFDAVASFVTDAVGYIREFYVIEADVGTLSSGTYEGLIIVQGSEATFEFTVKGN